MLCVYHHNTQDFPYERESDKYNQACIQLRHRLDFEFGIILYFALVLWKHLVPSGDK